METLISIIYNVGIWGIVLLGVLALLGIISVGISVVVLIASRQRRPSGTQPNGAAITPHHRL